MRLAAAQQAVGDQHMVGCFMPSITSLPCRAQAGPRQRFSSISRSSTASSGDLPGASPGPRRFAFAPEVLFSLATEETQMPPPAHDLREIVPAFGGEHVLLTCSRSSAKALGRPSARLWYHGGTTTCMNVLFWPYTDTGRCRCRTPSRGSVDGVEMLRAFPSSCAPAAEMGHPNTDAGFAPDVDRDFKASAVMVGLIAHMHVGYRRSGPRLWRRRDQSSSVDWYLLGCVGEPRRNAARAFPPCTGATLFLP